MELGYTWYIPVVYLADESDGGDGYACNCGRGRWLGEGWGGGGKIEINTPLLHVGDREA